MMAGGAAMRIHALTAWLGVVRVARLEVDAGTAWARATGGGSRGSRSYSSPAKPAPSPVAPANPAPMPSQPNRPGIFGGLMGGLAGLALGGLIGSMLFGGFGGGFGGGLGLLDILLGVRGAFFLIRLLPAPRADPAPPPAGALP